jgi:hypothetical protein
MERPADPDRTAVLISARQDRKKDIRNKKKQKCRHLMHLPPFAPPFPVMILGFSL